MGTSKNAFENFPDWVLQKWQDIADLLAETIDIPAALIMKAENEMMEVFISSHSENNPYVVGSKEKWAGLYCETVIKSQNKLFVPNAVKDNAWNNLPGTEPGMVAYLGYPINFPDNQPFGTICILDNKERSFTLLNEKLILQFKNVIELDLALLQSFELKSSQLAANIAQEITQRKQAEEELRNTKLNLELSLNASQIGIWHHNLIADPNHTKEVSIRDLKHDQIFGYKEKVALWGQEKMLEQVIDEDRLSVRAVFDNSLNTGTLNFECRILWPDQSIHWIACNGKVFKDSEGQANQMSGTVVDITERKRGEQALQESQNRLNEAQKLAHIGVWDWDTKTDQVIWSNELYQIAGRDPKLPAPTYPEQSNLYTPQSWQILEAAVEQTIKTGDKYQLELELIHTNGNIRNVKAFGGLKLDALGQISGLFGTLQDITHPKQIENDLKQRECELSRQNELFDSLIKNLPMGVFMVEAPSGKPLVANEAALKLLGRGILPDASRHNLDEVYHAFKNDIDHPYPIDEMPIIKGMKGESSYIDDMLVIRPDGTKTQLEIYGSPVKDNNGNIWASLVSFSDITNRKLSEAIFRDIVGKNPMSIQILNMEGYSIQTNSAHTQLFGAAPPTDYSIFKDTQLELQGFENLFEQIKKGEVVYFPDSYFNVHDVDPSFPDAPVWVKAVGFTLNDNNGIPERIVLMHENITERKHAEALLNDIIEKNPMSIQIVDKGGHTLHGNPAYTNLFGTIPPPDFSIFDDLQAKNKELEQLIKLAKSGEVVNLPDIYFNPHDEVAGAPDIPLWIRALIFPLNDSCGKPERFVFMHENITENKLAEAELKKSEERFDLAMKASNDGLFDWNLETNEMYYSPGWKKMLGYEDHELPNDFSVWQFTTEPEDVNKYLELQQKLITKEIDRLVFEFKMKHKEGHLVDILSRAEAIFNDKGQAIRIVGTHTDLTERKQLEDVQNFLVTCGYPGSDENFFESLAKYLSKTLNSEYVCIDKLEGDGLTAQTVAIYNEGKFDDNVSYTLKQTPCGVVVGKTICCFPENVCQLFPHDEALQDLKAQSYIGTTLRSFDGNPIGLIAIIGQQPLVNTAFAENVLKLVAIRAAGELERNKIEDELRLSKEKAEESEAKYRQIFDNTFDIMAIYEVTEDNRFKVVTFNAAEARLIGPIEYYQNRYIDECIPPELYNQFKPNYERCITEEKLIIYEEDIAFQDIQKTFNTQLIPLKNSAGRVHRIIVISRDITDNKILQTQLINQNEQLTLLNIDLIVSKDKAEEADRLKSAFLANMSHEIRTPMNGILGFAEILEDPELTGEQQQEYIKIIQKSGTRMLNIINDIVDISRIESGLMKMNIKESNINEQIEYIYTFFKPEVEAKGMDLKFQTTLPAVKAILYTDREKLYAILTNLVKNAIKFSNKGVIEFGYTEHTTNQPFLQFYVKDNGIGISKDRQEAIFERFIQADISDKMARQGAGLGLSISKAYVEMLGGKIWLESQPDIGSTFYFTLPYALEPEKNNTSNNHISADGLLNQLKKIKILIAEDDETSEILISLTVKEFSAEVIKARTGNDAVEICRIKPNLDLILMDIQMPDLNGYEATRQIRQFNKEVVIIAQTAYALSGDREKAIEAGCTDYIAKPINKYELQALIEKYFKK